MAVVDVLIETHRSGDDARGFRDGDGRFAPELVRLALLALADAEDVGFVQAVDLVLVASLLIIDPLE